MEQKMLRILLIQLKLITAGCVGFMIFFLSTAFRSEEIEVDPWKEMGISKAEGEDFITESFLRGYLYVYGTTSLHHIATGNRTEIAKEVLSYCKKHVNTPSFSTQYREFRRKTQPIAPAIKTKEQLRTELLSSYEEQILNNQQMVNYALVMKNMEMKRKAEKAMAKCRKIIEEINSESSKLMIEQMIYSDMRYQSELEKYQTRICKWEKDYPADTRQLIKRRLEYFLDLTRDIDFNATLKDMNGKKIFANPAYEQKPAEWKMGYRAGKDVVITARSFAAQWIKEISYK
jgi:hypothetical protein